MVQPYTTTTNKLWCCPFRSQHHHHHHLSPQGQLRPTRNVAARSLGYMLYTHALSTVIVERV